MAGIENHYALLDCGIGDGAFRIDYFETAMKRELRGTRVTVAGMGKSGLSALRLLIREGAIVRAVDNRPIEKLGPAGEELKKLGIELLPQTRESFVGAELIVLAPGVPVDLPELADARALRVPIIGEVELAAPYLKGPVIGITGSNGKTTTTAMTGHILRNSNIPVQVGGNIGTPLTELIDSSLEEQWNVLELSSFQLETIYSFRAQIGVALNVTPDHLDRHHTMEQYAAAKARLFETQTSGDYAVLNADDPISVSFVAKTKAHLYWFSLTGPVMPGVWLREGVIELDGHPVLKAEEVPLRGVHNLQNTMAATAAAHLAGAKRNEIANAIRTFPGVEHRLEFVRELNGVKYYNDSKATNVDATEKAIDAFSGGLWIILGGKDKNSDYTVLREKLQAKAKGILLIGAAAAIIEQQLKNDGLPLIQSGTLEAAVQRAASEATPGDTVLLAPACASFDQFENYEHRGRVFKSAVNAL
jgi:UDP-N-acetylmuramoylalanine--D-glutamate ligase